MMVALQRRQALVSEQVTLDGKRAVVKGWKNAFASVAALDGSTGDIEFAWETVERIVSRGGGFQS